MERPVNWSANVELLDAVEHAALQLKHLAQLIAYDERRTMAELRLWPPPAQQLSGGPGLSPAPE